MLATVTIYQRQDGTILDALRSVVDHVDAVFIFTAPDCDYDFAAERAICGDKLRTGSVPRIRDSASTAPARNEAARLAGEWGADWVLILDPDERMHWEADRDFRAVLADSPNECFVIRAQEGFYSKDKFMRPGSGEYQANAHEAWVPKRPDLRCLIVPGPKFSELPKDPSTLKRRDIGVVKQLRRDIRKEPTNARTHFYLGSTYAALGRLEKARVHLEEAIRNSHWGEEAAWSNYRLATMCLSQEKLDEAILHCCMALACNPAMAEAAWLAGTVRAMQQRAQDAAAWSFMAIATGCLEGVGKSMHRIHFMDPIGRWEGPYETLRAVYWAMGETQSARDAIDHWRDAYKQRLEIDGGPVLPDTDWRLHQYEPPASEVLPPMVSAERAAE